MYSQSSAREEMYLFQVWTSCVFIACTRGERRSGMKKWLSSIDRKHITTPVWVLQTHPGILSVTITLT